jgi:FkbM family methyltransferase
MITLKSRLSAWLGRSPVGLIPVRIRAGIAKGARWTLLPHSAYWRQGGEGDVDIVAAGLGPLTGQCFWDLGAHFGLYTVGLARLVGPTGQVASFEPDPRSHARCARHVAMNGLDNVRLFRAAVSNRATQQEFIVPAAGAPFNHLRYEDEPVTAGENIISIETLVLDKLVSDGRIRPPQLVKVDVEGHGAKAVAGALQTITRHHPVLVMSFHSHAEADDTQALLEPLGYRCFENDGRPLPWSAVVFRTACLKVPPVC